MPSRRLFDGAQVELGLLPLQVAGAAVDSPLLSLGVSAFAPSVSAGASALAPAGALGFSSLEPSHSAGASTSPQAASVALEAISPAVGVSSLMFVPAAVAGVSAWPATPSSGASASPPASVFAAAGVSPGLKLSIVAVVPGAGIVVYGIAPSLASGASLKPLLATSVISPRPPRAAAGTAVAPSVFVFMARRAMVTADSSVPGFTADGDGLRLEAVGEPIYFSPDDPYSPVAVAPAPSRPNVPPPGGSPTVPRARGDLVQFVVADEIPTPTATTGDEKAIRATPPSAVAVTFSATSA